jgi:hypothetical protein
VHLLRVLLHRLNERLVVRFAHIQRPMYPLDKDMKDPDLSVKWVPSSDRFK